MRQRVLAVFLAFLCVIPVAGAEDTGQIHVKCETGVTILLNGVVKGVSSAESGGLFVLDVPVGTYELKAVKEGCVPQVMQVVVAKDGVSVVRLGTFVLLARVPVNGKAEDTTRSEGTGSIEARTVPVECFVDCPSIGVSKVRKTESTWVVTNVPVGTHQLTLRLGDKSLDALVEVIKGRKTIVIANFETMEISTELDSLTEPVPSAAYAPLSGLFAGSREAQELQKQWVEKGYPLEVKLKGTDIRFRLIPPGSFDMGSAEDAIDAFLSETPVHRVTIGKPFYMAVTELTQDQWQKVMDDTPSRFKGKNLPVEQVSWFDCLEFLDRLRSSSGATGLRLPTEAEWEYACRAGTTDSRYGMPDAIAWHSGNSKGKTKPVGCRLANAWGLRDMLGNVREWCEDNWHDNYIGAPADGTVWLGRYSGRVLRGGCCVFGQEGCRSAFRISGSKRDEFMNCGFRLALDLAPDSPPEAATVIPCTQAPPTPTYLEPVASAQYAPLSGLFAGSREAQDHQREWVAKGYPLEVKLKGTDIRFRLVPPGEFVMGSQRREDGRNDAECPAHRVTISRPFYMAVTEITQAQWQKLMNSNPSHFSRDRCGTDTSDLPVETVSWNDCQSFIEKLRGSSGATGLRLPTEAEWEYACRAGTTAGRYGEPDAIAWYGGNSEKTTHPVSRKLANAWGLHDMVGNVSEWCEDNCFSDYYGAPTDGRAWLGFESYRVLRGGNWCFNAESCHSAFRKGWMPDRGSWWEGVRVALDLR